MNPVFKIMLWAFIALIIPVMGNRFVEGWNWSWHDFIFAWIFWVIMAVTILFTTRLFTKYKVALGLIVFLIFAAVWILLATG